MLTRWPLPFAMLALGCGGSVAADPIGGTYVVTAANGSDTCGFGWTQNASSPSTVKIIESPNGEGTFLVQSADGVLVSFLMP